MKLLAVSIGALTVGLANVASAERSFRLNFGSCHDVSLDENSLEDRIWETIISRQGDAYVWAGDNVYGDEGGRPATPEFLQELYELTSSIPRYSEFVSNIGQANIVGTWGM